LLHSVPFPLAAYILPPFEAEPVVLDLAHQCLFPKQYSGPEGKWKQAMANLQY
jgi:hypothetical protein